VITVGGYDDKNDLDPATIDLYHSNFGPTADGTVKPEIIAPAMWVAAPILPRTPLYARAETLSRLWAAPDYELGKLATELANKAEIPARVLQNGTAAIRAFVDTVLTEQKIVAAHYQHVDGTSFAAPIVASLVAQMIEANPMLTPVMIKKILISTADRIAHAPVVRQGYGVVDARQALSLAQDRNLNLETITCGPPRVENGKVLFFFSDDRATNVSLAGDFNGWDPNKNKLERDEHGFWRASLTAPPAGIYHYKFIVDERRWVEDPNNEMKAPDHYGGSNSLITIK
jgi:serine protease AprX